MNKQNTDLKHKYKCDFEAIQGFVNEFDPCGLIYSGFPIDEYDKLTSQILSSTYNGKTKTEIKELILYEIEHHFGTPDLKALEETNKKNFHDELERLIARIEKHIGRTKALPPT